MIQWYVCIWPNYKCTCDDKHVTIIKNKYVNDKSIQI